MNEVINALSDWGCDVRSAMGRMLDDSGFYLECLHEVVQDPYFSELQEALNEKDCTKAFNASHTLKGVLANLGLTPMYNTVVEIVEPLRAGKMDGLEDACNRLLEQKTHLEAILASN